MTAYGFDALNRMSSATENGSVALASHTLDALSRRTLLQMGGVATNQIGYTYESDSDLDVLTQTLNGTTVTLDHGHNPSSSSRASRPTMISTWSSPPR